MLVYRQSESNNWFHCQLNVFTHIPLKIALNFILFISLYTQVANWRPTDKPMYSPKCSHTWISCSDYIWFWSIERFTECNKATLSEYLIAEVRNMNMSKQIILMQYGTMWIINVSAIPFSYIDSHVLQNNSNKLFPVLRKVTTCCINIVTLLVETLFNKLLKCLILTFRELPKPGDWYLKISNRSEISQTEQQHNSWFSCQITERSGYF